MSETGGKRTLSCQYLVMDEATQALIDLLEGQRRLAQAMIDAHEAGSLGDAASPDDIAAFRAELADCEAQLAELRSGEA